MKNYLLLILILIFLSGCGSGGGISTTALTAAMNGTVAVSGEIVDASIAKELAVMNAWNNYYKVQEKIHKNSGINLTFEMIEIKKGVFIQVIKDLSVRPHITLDTPPEEPSKHPVWAFLTDFTQAMMKWGVIGYGIHELSGAWEASVAGAKGTTTYNGPVNGSFNTAGGAQTISRDYISMPITETITNTSGL